MSASRTNDSSTFTLQSILTSTTNKNCNTYSIPKVFVSSTANSNFSYNTSEVGYGGKSSLLKHVCALGRLFGFPHFSMQNFRGPIEPLKAEKPSNGMLEVPVTNWSSLSLCSLLNLQQKILKY